MVDRPKLDSMLSNLLSYVSVLKGLAAVSREQFIGNGDKIGNAKYHLVIAIESCIDIARFMTAVAVFVEPVKQDPPSGSAAKP